MFNTENSIEPATLRSIRKKEADIREATPAEMAGATLRRERAQQEPPVQAVRRGLFQRKSQEPTQPDSVSKTHGLYVAQKRETRTYYTDYQQKSEVMRADPAKISSKLSDRQTVTAMLDLAQSRGWDKVKLRGTEDFKREAWVQAQVRGVMTEGHTANDTDKQEVARRKQAAGPVEAVPKAAEPIKIAAGKPEPEVAKGWTEVEAKKMDATISAKVGRETIRSEPSAAVTRLAERQADPTDRMHDKGREAAANAHKPAKEMTLKEQTVDYERVNGAANKARAEEVRQHGSGGYKGDPGTDAAEKRAEIQGDATMQSLPSLPRAKAPKQAAPRNEISANVWGNVEAVGAQMRAYETSKQVKVQTPKAAVTAS